MRTRSLLFRLSGTAAALIVLALTLAAFGLTAIFDQEIERRAAVELNQVVNVIAARTRIAADDTLNLDVTLPDPRFNAPYGGIYWQVDNKANSQRARSRSLWDFVLAVPDDAGDNGRHVRNLSGPNKSTLLSVIRNVTLPSAGGDVTLQIVAAVDRADMAAAQRSFRRALWFSLATLGILLIVAMSVFIRLALLPFDKLAQGLRTIHAGESRSLGGNFPDEVQPVVDDLNRLIAFQDAAVERARTDAGDLAHGLKTPLAVLSSIARQASQDGRSDVSAPIYEQVTQMSRQVDRALAKARAGIAAPLGNKTVDVKSVAEKVVRALKRLPDTRPLDWHCDVASNALFAGEEDDLTEILGNLLDNARKWAAHRVRLTAQVTAGMLTLHIEDDGPGLSCDQATQIARGQRWDETRPGTGFGLAITRDLAEGYLGRLTLERSDLGGLSATVTVPLASRLGR